jgi:hypothetical protein
LDTAKRFTATEALEHPWLKGTTASDTLIGAEVLNSLKTFNGNNKFKAGKCLVHTTQRNHRIVVSLLRLIVLCLIAVLNLMTDYLSPAEITQLKATFQALDENKDGKISVAELKKAMNK